ncbi:hypothetical protein [Actinophytocola algeriensis]|uniref:Uncharacterized protein n=1 Tax=Actinophytocola algeriensis TaxID=1768010 RepID=A0A7W7QFG6_9PSEU|nr:hypothetical protein [Actinophytocola algeriensis]MBB4912680.1 hypothetical protein [Actinophytocola algeriensis]MBE1471986.1 hypothetical protein [Actinophytocola algeriensis]
MKVTVWVGLAVLGWGEVVHWRASHRRLGTADAAGAGEAVVVLGYRNRGRRANVVTRWRVRAGLRSVEGAPCSFSVVGPLPASGRRPT